MVKKYFDRLVTIDHLIRIRGTGRPCQLAKRLNLSERSLYDFLAVMKEFGANIKYNKERESYYYETGSGFEFMFRN